MPSKRKRIRIPREAKVALMLRLPRSVHRAIVRAATKNFRSLNEEIVQRLKAETDETQGTPSENRPAAQERPPTGRNG
jgi:hypothetical protein